MLIVVWREFKVGNFIERVKIDKSTVKKKEMEEKNFFGKNVGLKESQKIYFS